MKTALLAMPKNESSFFQLPRKYSASGSDRG